MGCCCSSGRAEFNRTPVYYYCPREFEEHEPLSSTRSTVSTGLLVDTNLDTSTPDTYQAPPAPLPYDLGMACSEALRGSFQDHSNKTDHMQQDCKGKIECEHESPKLMEDETSKLNNSIASPVEEEDVCPICLEEYDIENPRITTKCEHHFHLSCILEWMERSHTCPICDQIMLLEHESDG